jgi:hypothetical protein
MHHQGQDDRADSKAATDAVLLAFLAFFLARNGLAGAACGLWGAQLHAECQATQYLSGVLPRTKSRRTRWTDHSLRRP